MKKPAFHTYEQFEEAWKKESVPKPDVQSIKMSLLLRKKKNYGISRWLRPIPVSIVVLCICLIFVSGSHTYALLSKFILHDAQKNATFEYKQSSSERVEIDRKIESILSQYRSKMSEVADSLKLGEAVVFLIAEAYRIDGHYFPLQKDMVVTNIEQMKSPPLLKFKPPAKISPSYRFSKGTIHNKIAQVEHEQLEQWFAKSVDSNLAYLVEPVKLTDQVEWGEFSYVDEDNSDSPVLSVYMTESAGSMSTSNLDEQAEIINIGGSEVIYEPNHCSLTFVLQQDDTELQYTVLGNSLMTKQDFIQAVESLIVQLQLKNGE
ncbi:hypothetical protein A8990_12636 [Paenibacillus taihuensis]|uniref:DUF4367 domain-containing protein n=1 Tax=Paenibacillus taihuensis TaxID=1156355 RepID=A0A3D9RHH9_9BACL|nr:hypothetical protein [Paenibacillus taihuensis]REE78562.1 hypothetical protein A8990_12636 [Paenibacillus taihuensis]